MTIFVVIHTHQEGDNCDDMSTRLRNNALCFYLWIFIKMLNPSNATSNTRIGIVYVAATYNEKYFRLVNYFKFRLKDEKTSKNERTRKYFVLLFATITP